MIVHIILPWTENKHHGNIFCVLLTGCVNMRGKSDNKGIETSERVKYQLRVVELLEATINPKSTRGTQRQKDMHSQSGRKSPHLYLVTCWAFSKASIISPNSLSWESPLSSEPHLLSTYQYTRGGHYP